MLQDEVVFCSTFGYDFPYLMSMDVKSFWSLHGSLSRQRAISSIHKVFDTRAAMNADADGLKEHLAPYYKTLMIEETEIETDDQSRFLSEYGSGI